MSKVDLAAEDGVSEGAISWRLAQLHRDGLLVSRSPLIAAAATRADTAVTGRAIGDWELQAVAAARAALSAGQPVAAGQLLDVVLAAGDAAAGSAGQARISAETREETAAPREAQLASSASTSTSSSLAKTPRPKPRGTAVVVDRSVDEARSLVAELEDLARRCNLQGVSDPARLRDAIAGYDDAQVSAAVTHIVARVKARRVDSPIGYLIRIAEEGSPVFDLAPPPAARREDDSGAVLDVAVGETCPPEVAAEHLAAVRGRLQ